MSNGIGRDLMETLANHTQAASVLVVTGKLEDGLEKLLLTTGRPISNKLAKRIFSGMGPLHSFSGKIEVAYLFEVIDKPTFDDLMLIKDVRNIFAHTTQYIYFTTPDVEAKCRQLTTYKADDGAQVAFHQRALDLSGVLGGILGRMMFAKALREEPSLTTGDDD